MPDNDKKGNIFFCFGKWTGKCKQGMQETGNKHGKQTRYAIL